MTEDGGAGLSWSQARSFSAQAYTPPHLMGHSSGMTCFQSSLISCASRGSLTTGRLLCQGSVTLTEELHGAPMADFTAEPCLDSFEDLSLYKVLDP